MPEQFTLPVIGEKANFLDLEPTMNENVDKDAFQGFKKAQADGSTTQEAAADLATQAAA